MPAGIYIDGQLVLEAGVFVENLYAAFNSGPSGQGIVAVVGSFPFLEPGVLYSATSETAFLNLIAPNDPTIKLLAQIIYHSSRNVPGGPGLVCLISDQPATAAEVNLLSDINDPADITGVFVSKIFGQRGNATQVTISENEDIGGYLIELTVMGVTDAERVQTSDEASVLTIDYARSEDKGAWSNATAYVVGDYVSDGGVWYRCIQAHTNQDPPNGTYWAVVTTSYGLKTLGGGSGVIEISKTSGPNEIVVEFARTVPIANCLTNANISLQLQVPVAGVIAVSATVGVTLTTATAVTVKIVGPTATGVQEEILTLTPDDVPNLQFDSIVTATGTVEWQGAPTIYIYPNDNVSGHISAGASGFIVEGVMADLNKVDGTTSIADVIADLSKVKGFTTSTGSNNIDKIPAGQLDNLPLETLPATFGAKVWSISKAMSDQASFVDFEIVSYDPPDVDEPVSLTAAGGTEGSATDDTLQTAFNELLKYKINGVVPLKIGTTVETMLLAHCNLGWGKWQTERVGYYGVTANATYSALAAAARRINSQRMERCHQRIKVTTPTGLQTLETYYAALMIAAASNINRRRQLDKWQPNIDGIEQHATLNNPDMNEALMALAYNVFAQKNFTQPFKLQRSLTTWRTDNNPYRTSPASVRSSADMQDYLRTSVELTIENTDSPASLLGLIGSSVSDAMSQLVQLGVIEGYDPSTINVTDIEQAFEVEVEYTPSGSKAQVKIKATVVRPSTLTA